MDAQARFGDHAEGALAAHEELGQVGPGGGTGAAPFGAHGAAVRQDHLEAEHHVLDLAVAGGVLTRTAAGEPSPHRRELHRLGPVSEGVAGPHLGQRPLEIGAEGPRPHVGGERGLVHGEQAVERREVERHPAEDGDGPATHPAAAGNGRHRYDGFVARRQDGGDLGGGSGPHDQCRTAGDGALRRPPDGQGPPVPAGLGPGGVVVRHVDPAPDEVVDQAVGQGDAGAGQPVGDRLRCRVDGRDRGGGGHGRSSPAVRSSFW